ncbi:MAG: hypothetical protein KA515_00420 [Candidatus Pacebacteria bacterium]|nr:hypothetical protein [Candidatus Paceibacterota bacterium]
MKFIFDFDDVLFNNTKEFKPYMYGILENAGIPRDVAEPYYQQVRVNQYWLKDLLKYFSLNENLYEKILDKNVIEKFINHEVLSLVKNIGKENCFILSHGGEEFQLDKITKTDIKHLFSDVFVIFDTKTTTIEKICTTHPNEQVVFIDDKTKYFEGLDFVKYPNLKTILFDENGLEKLKIEVAKI